MSRPYRSRMGRASLEDGPDEPSLMTCDECNGECVTPATKFAPRGEIDCWCCDGTGEVDYDPDESCDE